MKLDYVIVSDTAFFSEDKRASIIKIFNKLSFKEPDTPLEEGEVIMTPPFAITGRVSGDYGDGISIEVYDSQNNLVIKNTKIKATELNKSEFNFIADISTGVKAVEGFYSIQVKDYLGETNISGKIQLFSVSKI